MPDTQERIALKLTCQQWSATLERFTQTNATLLTTQQQVHCKCESIVGDMAVLREDVAVYLEAFGCLDTTALTFDLHADIHDDTMCVYASPPPPPILRDLIGFYRLHWLAFGSGFG